MVVHCRISYRSCDHKSVCCASHEDGARVEVSIAFEYPISSAIAVAPSSCHVQHIIDLRLQMRSKVRQYTTTLSYKPVEATQNRPVGLRNSQPYIFLLILRVQVVSNFESLTRWLPASRHHMQISHTVCVKDWNIGNAIEVLFNFLFIFNKCKKIIGCSIRENITLIRHERSWNILSTSK